MQFPENLVDFALDRLGNLFTMTLAFHSKFETSYKVTPFCPCLFMVLHIRVSSFQVIFE